MVRRTRTDLSSRQHDHDPGDRHVVPRPPARSGAACRPPMTTTPIVRRAIAYISEHWRAQPEVEQIAHAVGVTPDELHHLFRRWAGLTPKAFLQALTLDNARKLLRDSRERARRDLRGRPLRPRPAARPVRHPRGDVAGRMEIRRRRPDHLLRLPPLAVRHRAGDGDAARACGPRLRRSRRGKGDARRHARPLAEGDLCGGQVDHRAARGAHLRSDACGARTGRCAS